MLVISPIDYIGRCVSNCPDSTFMGETMCNPCPKGCLNCWSASLCWKCNTGLYLSAGKCVSQCPLGMRLSNDGTQCQLCNSPCSTCFYNNGKEYCASCRQGSGTFLYLGSCVYQCPQGYYAAHSKCLACSSNCATCLSLKTCSTCKSGFFYLPTLAKCATTCPVGTYSSSGICQPCSDSCNRCQSSTNCT